jgi:hypothetical protein
VHSGSARRHRQRQRRCSSRQQQQAAPSDLNCRRPCTAPAPTHSDTDTRQTGRQTQGTQSNHTPPARWRPPHSSSPRAISVFSSVFCSFPAIFLLVDFSRRWFFRWAHSACLDRAKGEREPERERVRSGTYVRVCYALPPASAPSLHSARPMHERSASLRASAAPAAPRCARSRA